MTPAVDNKAEKLTWQILLWVVGILILCAGAFANTIYTKVSSIETNLNEKGERLATVEANYRNIEKKLDDVLMLLNQRLNSGSFKTSGYKVTSYPEKKDRDLE